jgi:hypothetical protein
MLPRKNSSKILTEKEINHFKLLDFQARGKVINSGKAPDFEPTVLYLDAIIDLDRKNKQRLTPEILKKIKEKNTIDFLWK